MSPAMGTWSLVRCSVGGVAVPQNQRWKKLRTVALNPLALTYINRLSDYLFVAARAVNKSAGGDVLWKPGALRRN